MITAELKKAITASISDVLETMFFMVMEIDEPDADKPVSIFQRQHLRGCRLQFRGPFSGLFMILVPEDLLTDMAVDFMGESPENITSQHTEGTLKEVVNMIAGNAFGHYDDTITFHLEIPELIDAKNLKTLFESGGDESVCLKIATEKSEILIKAMIRK